MSTRREECLSKVADYITARRVSHPLRVAIDGRTASGKMTFADELGPHITARGRYSVAGYYFDARDLEAVRRLLLDPLGAEDDSILLVDGTFLQRPELRCGWDVVVFR